MGANQKINGEVAIFVRINKGYKMPYFDDFRGNYNTYQSGESLIKEVAQLEIGYKYMSQNTDFFATLFANEVKGDTFIRQFGTPAEILTNEAFGIEFDYTYNHQSGLSVNLNATWQDAEITESQTK